MNTTFIFRNGGYVVVASFAIVLIFNGITAVLYFFAGHVLMGIWALAGILILPKSVLGIVLLTGRRSGVSANLPLGFYSLFPRTLRRYRGDDWPPLETRIPRLLISELMWATIALLPVAILIYFGPSR